MEKRMLPQLLILVLLLLLMPGFTQDNLKVYRNDFPAFEISIPNNLNNWKIRETTNLSRPIEFAIVTGEELPQVNTYIELYGLKSPEIQQIWSDADKLFQSKTSYAKTYEKSVLPDIEFISDKRISLAGLPAFDRVCRSQELGRTYHIVYVLFPEGLVEFSFKSSTDSFKRYDEEFIAILNTLKKL